MSKTWTRDSFHPSEIMDKIVCGEFESMDFIMDYFDDLFLDGEFEFADSVLTYIRINKLEIDVMLTLLIVTSWAKDKLKNRPGIYYQIKKELIDRGMNNDELQELLKGLAE